MIFIFCIRGNIGIQEMKKLFCNLRLILEENRRILRRFSKMNGVKKPKKMAKSSNKEAEEKISQTSLIPPLCDKKETKTSKVVVSFFE